MSARDIRALSLEVGDQVYTGRDTKVTVTDLYINRWTVRATLADDTVLTWPPRRLIMIEDRKS